MASDGRRVASPCRQQLPECPRDFLFRADRRQCPLTWCLDWGTLQRRSQFVGTQPCRPNRSAPTTQKWSPAHGNRRGLAGTTEPEGSKRSGGAKSKLKQSIASEPGEDHPSMRCNARTNHCQKPRTRVYRALLQHLGVSSAPLQQLFPSKAAAFAPKGPRDSMGLFSDLRSAWPRGRRSPCKALAEVLDRRPVKAKDTKRHSAFYGTAFARRFG